MLVSRKVSLAILAAYDFIGVQIDIVLESHTVWAALGGRLKSKIGGRACDREDDGAMWIEL